MAPSSEFTPDVTVLLPRILDFDRVTRRYAGLFDELGECGLSAMLVADMNHTYSEERLAFKGGYDYSFGDRTFTYAADVLVKPKLVRDLTMAIGGRPLYRNPEVTLVHQPAFNAVLANRATVWALLSGLHADTHEVTTEADLSAALELLSGQSVLVKPVEASETENKKIFSANRALVAETITERDISGPLLVQEYVETEQGIPELNIEGRHKVRTILIGGRAVFASSKASGDVHHLTQYYWPDELPRDIRRALDEVQESLTTLPDGVNTIVAADFMRGRQEGGEEKVYLDGLFRKPLRASAYQNSKPGEQWAANRWDKHEAELLYSKFSS